LSLVAELSGRRAQEELLQGSGSDDKGLKNSSKDSSENSSKDSNESSRKDSSKDSETQRGLAAPRDLGGPVRARQETHENEKTAKWILGGRVATFCTLQK